MPTSNAQTIITLSGVHGVGKTTTLSALSENLGTLHPQPRAVNPFTQTMLSLAFYVLSFAERDDSLCGAAGLAFIDRDSVRDILVDVWAHRQLGYITADQEDLVVHAAKTLLVPRRRVHFSFLLDDTPDNVLSKLRGRTLPQGHLKSLEYDLEYVERLVSGFQQEFATYAITAGIYGVEVGAVPSMRVSVAGKTVADVVAIIVERCRRWGAL